MQTVNINEVKNRFLEIVDRFKNDALYPKFVARIGKHKLTRDENPTSHFCVYFAGFDAKAKKVFIGHHKKSGLWLFNGGHIDKGETSEQALRREMEEEWGETVDLQIIGEPKLLTITTIVNPVIKCKKHFDIWYFVPLSEISFQPNQLLLETEFYVTAWKDIDEAKKLITDPNTQKALTEFENIFKKDDKNS